MSVAVSLSNVRLDHKNCVGCNNCIRFCPEKRVNLSVADEQGNTLIDLRPEYCIDCGTCIKHCHKRARYFLDDTEAFMNDFLSGKKISIIFAPAFKTNYPKWKNILGWFKHPTLGQNAVNQIYDTSFGAEITTWAYLKFITASGKGGWISQPCPVVVNMIEKYYPNLVHNLVPIHSPMHCAAVYMQKYKNIQDNLAFLSPCIAKRDEIRERNIMKYNVTYKTLMEWFQKHDIDPEQSPEAEPDNIAPQLGSFFPIAGGLREN
ncbi:MAG: 4Fe-4S dicluster domain-containing protein, partial [Oscillospiraceae bacterium]|nr:4Fe-4S dicluster domain-containing protein [Oscillospiraceae bacterium]